MCYIIEVFIFMVAKYEVIKQDIIRMIENGEFKPGDKIYSEGELKKIYSVSSTTVVRALQDLVLEGYLIRKQGEGTYVRKNFKHRRAFFDEVSPIFGEIGERYSENKLVESKKMISIEEILDENISKKLKLPSFEFLIHFCRVSYVNGVPWQIQNSYIPKKYLKNFDYYSLGDNQRLSDELNRILNINLMTLTFKQKIQIEFPILDKNLAEILNVNLETPLYKIERISYYPAQVPFEYAKNYIHHKYYSVEIQTEGGV